MGATIQLRRGLAAAVAGATVADGEPLWTTDTHVLYVGEGGTAYPVSGATGPAGANGAPGAAATIAVGTVTTGAAGTSATVGNSGTSSAAVFDFSIPRGDTGATGATGPTGATGATGATGSAGVASATAPLHLTGSTLSIDDPLGAAHGGTGSNLASGADGVVYRQTGALHVIGQVPCTWGGTNVDASAWQVGAMWCIGAATGVGDQVPAQTLARRQVLTETGDGSGGAIPAWADWITASNGSTPLPSTHALTTSAAWEDTGLSVTLPSKGTYLVAFSARLTATISAGSDAYMAARLFDVTAGAAVVGSARQAFLIHNTTVGAATQNVSGMVLVTVAASHVLRLEAWRDGTGVTWSASSVTSISAAETGIAWVKIAE